MCVRIQCSNRLLYSETQFGLTDIRVWQYIVQVMTTLNMTHQFITRKFLLLGIIKNNSKKFNGPH